MGEYLVYCPRCYGMWSVWPVEEFRNARLDPLKAVPESDHVICKVHGKMSMVELLEEFGENDR